jgi:hypothetical protein
MKTLLLLSILYTGTLNATWTEEQKINHLINYVSHLKDAVFIRNGSEYTPGKAAEHLRMKRDKAGSRIKTAKDFIYQLATKSSFSGEAYTIRYSTGHISPSKDVLLKELTRINELH